MSVSADLRGCGNSSSSTVARCLSRWRRRCHCSGQPHATKGPMPFGSSLRQREEGKRCSPTMATARAGAIPVDGDGCALRWGSVSVGVQGGVSNTSGARRLTPGAAATAAAQVDHHCPGQPAGHEGGSSSALARGALIPDSHCLAVALRDLSLRRGR